METRKLSLVYAIAGFFYTAFLFIILLCLFGIYDLTNFFRDIKEYLPYLSIIFFFLSYVMGIITEPILQKLVFRKRRESFNAIKQINMLTEWPESLRNNLSISFDKLVILRHFVVGLILLSGSLVLWLLLSDIENRVNLILIVVTTGSLLIVLSIIAYSVRKNIHNQLENAISDLLNK